jgi:hypothetical protein
MNKLLPMLRRDEPHLATSWTRRVGVSRSGAGRWALAVLLGCVALLATAPVAAAAGGSIVGTVTDHSAKPVPNVAVSVFNVSHQLVGSGKTDGLGKYTVEELGFPALYRVEFFPPPETKFLTQYYKGKSSFSTADLVEVKGEGEATVVNAEVGEGGTISGTVTDTSKHPVPVQVFVSLASESEIFFEGFAKTNPSTGEYIVKGLPSGSYRVQFFPEFGLNFVPQYYKNMPGFSTATLVEVIEEKPVSKIDAELQTGGKISGTVTDAATHKPLAGVFVGASPTSEGFGGAAETNTNGEYSILGLATGSYNLEFELFSETEGGSAYLPLSDNGVGATQGRTTSGINVSLTPKKPNNTGSPVASGTPSVGQTLSCSNGSWIGAPTLTYAYKWLRDGSAITGATGSTYVVQSADQGHGLSCEVTATNPVGHASATSNTLKVTAAAPPPPLPPTLSAARLTNKRFRVAKKDTALSAKKAPLGTIFRFALSAPSNLQIAITRSAPGLRHGRGCLAPTKKLRKAHAKHCTRTLKMGTLRRSGERAETDSVPFSGRLGHRPLAPGAYKAVLVASGPGGLSAPVALTFVIVR